MDLPTTTTRRLSAILGAPVGGVNSRFAQVPRNEFARLVGEHRAKRNAKGFTCWTQFTAMLFCQLAHADSLRQICNGLACCMGKAAH